MSWRDTAACRGQDPDLFFPLGTTGTALEQTAQAKALCASCPVAQACLAWALATSQPAGIWGGKTEDERHALRRKQQRRKR